MDTNRKKIILKGWFKMLSSLVIIGMIIVTFQTIHSPEHLKGNDVQYVVKNEEVVGIIK